MSQHCRVLSLLFIVAVGHSVAATKVRASCAGAGGAVMPRYEHRFSAGSSDPAPARRTWFASAAQGFARFSSDRPSWYDGALVVGTRQGAGRATFGELARMNRHGDSDLLVAADHYEPLGRRSYANVRLAIAAGADVIPSTDLYMEAFRGSRAGYEVSAGYRFARFDDRSVHTMSAGIAKYVGNWYFRVKNSITPIEGSVGYAVLLTARRYGVSSEEFVGATVAAGREIIGGPVGRTLVRSPYSASVYGQRFLTAHAGIRLSVDAVRDGNLSRWGLSIGALFRW